MRSITHLTLLWELTKRDVELRYRGSMFGMSWALLQPVLLIGVYYLVFGIIFSARWPTAAEQSAPFLLILFAGLIPFSVFAEVANRASTLVVNNVNYVKKIVFPLELLAAVTVLSTLVQFFISLIVWIVMAIWLGHSNFGGLLYVPVLLLAYVAMLLGVTWALAALGVYIRDLPQIVAPVVSLLLFLSPILYPIEAVPARFRSWFELNPLAGYVELFRQALIGAEPLDPMYVLRVFVLGLLVGSAGFYLFKMLRRGFSDVL